MGMDMAGQAAAGEADKPALQKVDWKKMITIVGRKRDAEGMLLPLQSYDEAIRRGRREEP